MSKKLGFGMMRLPVIGGDDGNVDFDKTCVLVDTFMERGFTYFDTSFVYHNCHSEEITRRTVVERHPRNSFTLATKLPAFLIELEEDVEKTFHQQCANLGVDYLDYYLLHNINGELYSQKLVPLYVFETCARLKKEGKIKNLGFSFHDVPEQLDIILSEHPEVDFVQIVLNYYDWTSSWIQSKNCYDIIRKHGKQVIIMEPVKGGILANPPKPLSDEMQALHPGMSPASWAIRFAQGMDGVLAILSGMSTPEQVIENTALFDSPHPLTDEERQILINSAPLYRSLGQFHLDDLEPYKGIGPGGFPVDELLSTYNSWLLQKSRGAAVCAEQCYTPHYKRLLKKHNVPKDWTKQTILNRNGQDISEMVREAEAYFLQF